MDSNCLSDSKRIEVNRHCVTEEQCLEHGWNLTGNACYDTNITKAVPDVFLLSVMLFIGTFAVAMTFRMFRTSRFFPTIVSTGLLKFILQSLLSAPTTRMLRCVTQCAR